MNTTTIPTQINPEEMSVVRATFDSGKGVAHMVSAPLEAALFTQFVDAPAPGHAAPHGFDRLVMRLSVTMLIWARNHADRIAVSHQDRSSMLADHHSRAHRERVAMLMAYRQR
jgi:hypothetical protein